MAWMTKYKKFRGLCLTLLFTFAGVSHASERERSISRGPEDHSALPFGVYNIWKNVGPESGQIITIEIKSKD